jgi:DNA-binding response OmpR family regulator
MTAPCDIFVVDDEPVVRDAAVRILADAGFRTTTIDTGAAALAHPDANVARLLLLDVMLPDQSGLDVLRQLRARRVEVPVVLMTGYTLSPELATADSIGRVHILAKPFDDDELLAAVHLLLKPVTKEALP